MMSVVQKWKIVVTFPEREVILWINDNHVENVLRKLADLQFSEKGLEWPVKIELTRS